MSMKMKIKYLVLFLVLLMFSNLFSQWLYFGRNKIQYKKFDWHLMKTEHFNIYYYPEMQDLAKIGAKFAEESYKYLEEKFNHTVLRRIPLIFYNSHIHFQQTNIIPFFLPEGVGGFTEYIKGRVAIPFKGDLKTFRTTITHELVHVFMFSKVNRVQKDHRIANKAVVPFWFQEGLADYWAGDWNSHGEMVLRDMIINNNFYSLEDIHSITGSYLAYKEGQNLLQYISNNFGEERIRLIMDNIWKEDKFNEILENTLGIEYKKLGKDWEYYLKKKYYPLLENKELPTFHAKKITSKGYNRMPNFYKDDDKEKLIFITNRTGYTNIVMKSLEPEDENIKILIKGERTSNFEKFHLFENSLDVNSKNELAFIVKSGPSDILYIMNIKSKKITDKFQFDDIISITSPCWSDDGNLIVFSGLNMNGKKDIYSLNIRNRKKERLTDDFFEDNDPIWLIDGELVLFSSNRGSSKKEGSYNLVVIDLLNGNVKNATTGFNNDYSPVKKESDNLIAFVSEKDDVPNIWGIKYKITQNDERLLISEPFRITNYITAALEPDWTEDGDLVFTTFERFKYNIQMIENLGKNINTDTLKLKPSIKLKLKWEPEPISKYNVTETKQYKKKYSLDLAQGQVMQDPFFGTTGGAQIAISDMLGDDKYYFLLYNNSQSTEDFFSSFSFAITRLYLANRFNFGYGFYHLTGRRIYSSYYDDVFWERRYGASFSVSYPISQFRRIEANLYFNRSDKDWGYYRRKALMVSNYISYVKDNSIWGLTGPIEGNRYNITVGFTKDIKYNNVNYWTFMFDYRKYFRLSSRITLASRLMTLYNEGKEAYRYYFGGSWDLRGYKRLSIGGEKICLSSTELRFPFIDFLGISFPFINMGFRGLKGALFLDFGNSWNKKYDETLGSFGLGIRLNLFGALVLRYDTGRKFINLFEDVTRSNFHQVFFGWDF